MFLKRLSIIFNILKCKVFGHKLITEGEIKTDYILKIHIFCKRKYCKHSFDFFKFYKY